MKTNVEREIEKAKNKIGRCDWEWYENGEWDRSKWRSGIKVADLI